MCKNIYTGEPLLKSNFSYYEKELLASLNRVQIYPVTPLKGAAPLSGSIKDFTNFWKQNRQKRAHVPFFVALIFRYKTNIFQNKKKLHIDLKRKTLYQVTKAYHSQNLYYLGRFAVNKVNFTLFVTLDASTFQWVKGTYSVIPFKCGCAIERGNRV